VWTAEPVGLSRTGSSDVSMGEPAPFVTDSCQRNEPLQPEPSMLPVATDLISF